eukprot:3075013-Rhodomonas_salina.1
MLTPASAHAYAGQRSWFRASALVLKGSWFRGSGAPAHSSPLLLEALKGCGLEASTVDRHRLTVARF